MQFIKTRDVKSPVRVVGENAGIDIYIPENTEDFRKDMYEKNKMYHFELISNYVGRMTHVEEYLHDMSISYLDDSDGTIHIAPHRAVIIPTGIRSKFGPELALIANNKSGIATKKQLIFGASVIDCSYQGEWHVNLINTSNEWQVLECGQKAIQFIPHLISTEEVEVLDMSPEEFYTEKTSRGEGGFGSTGIS